MKIFDCFPFLNELELLELRFAELNDTVDYFVLVEANKTHTGKPKEWVFGPNKDRYKQYLDKIIYVQVEDLPDYSREDIWKAENFQRNAIMRGLEGIAEKGDKILVSDADEIPNTDTIKENLSDPHWLVFQQTLFYYYVNCKLNQTWRGTVMATYGTFEFPQQLRNYVKKYRHEIANGGWHYSYLGDIERIKYKVSNIAESHIVINRLGDDTDIARKIASGVDLYERGGWRMQMSLIDISKNKPKHLDTFLEKYPLFLAPLPSKPYD